MAELVPWHEPVRAAIEALRRRGSHAILLHGPAGNGKLDLALSTANDLLCETPDPSGRACGTCPGCLLFEAGNHPDLRVIVPETMADRRPGAGRNPDSEAEQEVSGEPAAEGRNKPSRELKIEPIRELAEFAGITTHRGGARVVVLAPVEALNPFAGNALLKVLEEPPAGTVFLLVSDRIDLCLPTVRSRCALLRVPVPPRATALKWLRAQGVDDPERRLSETGGAPIAALRGPGDDLEPETRVRLLAMLERGVRLTPADVAIEVPRTVPIGGAVALFQRWGWDYLAYRLARQLRYHPDRAPSFERLARSWTLPAACAWLDALRVLRADAEHPLNARSAIEGVLLMYSRSVAGRGEEAGRT